jgi:RNase adaptor protein for sRNA GlmZ degradation
VTDHQVTVISFGFGHGPAPEAHALFDVRDHFRDPHVDPALRSLTGEHPRVIDKVLATPGVLALISSITEMAGAFRAGQQAGPVTIAVGCVGGRHRSAVIAAEVASRLAASGVPVTLIHRDIRRPVIARPTREVPTTSLT